MFQFDPKKHEGVDLRPSDFTTQYDASHWYPFFENENGGYVYAYGHGDKKGLAALVTQYFRDTGDDPEFEVRAEDVTYAYAFAYMPKGGTDEDWVFEIVSESHPGRFPLTFVSI